MIYLLSILAIAISIIWATYRAVQDLIKSGDKKLFNAGVGVIASVWIGGVRLIFILIEKL
jgi:4-hydroxybenzoate polyprenyltransferase